MKLQNDKAPGRHPRGSKPILLTCNSNITVRTGSYTWRKQKGLLTISDQVSRYRSIRSPRGSYRTPLPEDLI
jgi:hypothetical protein